MKKTLSLILCMVIVLSSLCMTTVMAESGTNEVTVYVTISKHGEIISDKNDNLIAMTPILLSDKSSYTLDDVFLSVHNELYDAGETGYESKAGDYGPYVSKFWDDESGNFTYQVNFTVESVWGLSHEIKSGDCVEFCINKSIYPHTEAYSKFDNNTLEILAEETADLTLLQGEYTADGMSFSACGDAVITINGVPTENITDENGNVSICFNENGRYVISAVKTKILSEETVPAIEAPVCIVTVGEALVPPSDAETDIPDDDFDKADAEKQLHNIIKKYLNDSIINDGNLCWFIADFADYLKIYPESEYFLSNKQKQACVDTIIAFADETSSQGDLSKAIIALRSLGYDAKNTYRKNGTHFDIVEKLSSLITEESVKAPFYEYTLPYVLIALEQDENYATEETVDLLINTALESKDAWQNTQWGIDGAAPMLRALAPYYSTNEDIKALADETAELIKAFQGSDGSMGNAASTGLAIAGLSSIGISPETVQNGENNLIDGLMSQTNETFDGFLPSDNSFCTEQGLRGLISWKLYVKDKKIYDFKGYPKDEARATREDIHTPSRGGSITSVKNKEETKITEIAQNKIQGLPDKNSDVKILPVIYSKKTFDDIVTHPHKTAIEQLASRGVINGRDEKNYCPDDTITRAEFTAIAVRALGIPLSSEKIFTDVSENDWFNAYVSTAHNYGIVNGVNENEFNPLGEITREEAAVMTMRAAQLCGIKTDINSTAVRNILSEFSDYITASDWSTKALAICFNEAILDKTALNIEPKEKITRSEVAQIIFNMLGRADLL